MLGDFFGMYLAGPIRPETENKMHVSSRLRSKFRVLPVHNGTAHVFLQFCAFFRETGLGLIQPVQSHVPHSVWLQTLYVGRGAKTAPTLLEGTNEPVPSENFFQGLWPERTCRVSML